MITAHGGAMDTGRNSREYFEAIDNGLIISDAIEVDVRGNADNLYISHLPTLFSKKCIPLKFVFEFAISHKLIVNFDIKNKNLFVPVRDMAIAMKAEEYLLFTGATTPDHIKDLTTGQIYANNSFFKGLEFNTANVLKIKEYVDSFKNPRLKGINVNYKKIDEGFLAECARVGLKVSLYTVDDEDALKKYVPMELDNVTTNRPDLAWDIKEKIIG